MRKVLVRLAQAAVTVVVLVWIFRDPQMRGTLSEMRRADWRWLLLGVAVSSVGEIANIWRWGIFLRVQKIDLGWLRVAAVFMIGVFFSLFSLGLVGGDVVKMFYLTRTYSGKKGAIFLAIAADRLIGLSILIPFSLAIVIARYRWLGQTPYAATLLAVLIVFIAGSILFFAAIFFVRRFGYLAKMPMHFPCREQLIRLDAAYDLFAKSRRETWIAFWLSFPVLFTFFGTFYCAARAFGNRVGFVDFFSVMPVITFVSSLPISIGGLGVREELFKNLLGDLAHVAPKIAVLISLTGFAIYTLWSLVGAVTYLLYKSAPPPTS